ncbi:TetR family transcriptional regulator [Microbacterium sp. NPDC056234]|uniref:TetR family transcriptional regulator n=1 Tax=Microbacterium sp. NPDC056234 TaxID=3345757 RepID=UPI0035D9ACD3
MATGLRALKRTRTRMAIADSALRLFIERGFDAVTVAQVAASAEVSERTVFRYFIGKEDLLFAEDDDFRELLTRELAARDLTKDPIVALCEATTAIALSVEDRRAELIERWKLVESSSALQARERARHQEYEKSIYSAYVEAGVAVPTARLTARFGMVGYAESLQRWLEGNSKAHFRTHVEATYAEMRQLLS